MEITIAIIAAVIIALTEVVKRVFVMTEATGKRILPLVNILLGLVLGFIFLQTGDLKMDLLYGLLAGLSAGGLYDISPIRSVVKAIGSGE